MKVVICPNYGPPDVLQIKELEKPVPKDHEILVKVIATTVTVADVRARSFTVPRSVWLPARIALGIRRPKRRVLGAELAGVVEAVGKAVKRFEKGDQVFAATLADFGAYSEYTCLPEEGAVAIKPDNISFEEAAAIPIGARTALHYLRKANVRSGQNVLVYGASGSVGTYAVQIAKSLGAHVTGVCSTSNVEMVKALGADEVIDYTTEQFSAQGSRFDVIFEAVNKSSFVHCMSSLKSNGVYINIAEPLPTLRMMWTKLSSKRKLLLGQNSPETAEALEFLRNLVTAGRLKPVIDRRYPLEQIAEAHRYVDKGHKKGNVVIQMVSTN